MTEKKDNSWFKQHADTITVLSAFAICFWTLNEKIEIKFNALEKDIAVIKTVMVMKNLLPSELATQKSENFQ